MKKFLSIVAGTVAILWIGLGVAQANTSSVDPATGVVSVTNTGPDGASYEFTSTAPVADGDILSFEYRSEDVECGGGAPRVFVQGGAYNTFDGNPDQCGTEVGDGWYLVTGTVDGVTAGEAGLVGLVNDNPGDLGTVEFRNVEINGSPILPPANKDQCRNGGWKNGSFKNQGACVSSFASAK